MGTTPRPRAERLGAERAIDYRSEDFAAVVRELTDGRGVDVVLDMVAGDYIGREIECLADDGRLALIAVQGGAQSSVTVAVTLAPCPVPSFASW